MNCTGSDFFVEQMKLIDPSKKGTSEQRCSWKSPDKLMKFDYARSFVGCVMRNGKPLKQELSGVVNKVGEEKARSLIAWSKPDTWGRRHFFLVAFKNWFDFNLFGETWDGVTAFFSENGRLRREMAKTFGVPNIQIDTVIWLDGGTSSELDYMVRKSRTTWHPDGPRSSANKYHTDIISVKSPLPPLQVLPEE